MTDQHHCGRISRRSLLAAARLAARDRPGPPLVRGDPPGAVGLAGPLGVPGPFPGRVVEARNPAHDPGRARRTARRSSRRSPGA